MAKQQRSGRRLSISTAKESRLERRITARRARRDATRQLRRGGDADAIEPRRGTQGWRTW